MTYAELCAAVQNYVENTFTTTDLDTFIKNAEQRIYNTVQLADLRKNVTGVITANNKYLACPTDFLAVYSIAVYSASSDYLYLLNKDVSFLREAYPNSASTGQPKYYSIFGPRSDNVNELTFILAPTPNAEYTVELHYFYYPESIVTAGSTWLSDNFDSALLYGTILEAYTFLKGETDIMQNYIQRYNEAMSLLRTLSEGKDRSDAYRSGQARVPVK